MSRLADICDLVPGWLYALAVAALSFLLIVTELDRYDAVAEAARAGQSLSDLVATSATVAASRVSVARVKEADMAASQAKDVHELNQAISNPGARIALLQQRMRDQASDYARANRGCVRPAPNAASGGDGGDGAGLRGLVEQDPVVLDGQAQREVAEFVVSARQTAETLKTGRKALERCAAAAE